MQVINRARSHRYNRHPLRECHLTSSGAKCQSMLAAPRFNFTPLSSLTYLSRVLKFYVMLSGELANADAKQIKFDSSSLALTSLWVVLNAPFRATDCRRELHILSPSRNEACILHGALQQSAVRWHQILFFARRPKQYLAVEERESKTQLHLKSIFLVSNDWHVDQIPQDIYNWHQTFAVNFAALFRYPLGFVLSISGAASSSPGSNFMEIHASPISNPLQICTTSAGNKK